ncbi:MAG: HPF/RaiA family ribosome-associated protein [Intrasporangiaceae bacterium]|nr:HPF/RaiA family ribosome-associated protein [Intrasporangiaceae bacterium]
MTEPTVDSSIVRLGGGFAEYDRHLIETTLQQLLSRVATSGRAWQMELSVKEREKPGQQVTLEAWVPGQEKFVATSNLENVRDALNDVGADVLTQFDRARDRNARDNRKKRETIRGQ